MDKASSVTAAFAAGKLPSTQQFNVFIDWLNDVGITQVEPSSNTELSSRGRILAGAIRQTLDAYKQLLNNKNGKSSSYLSRSRRKSHIPKATISCKRLFGTSPRAISRPLLKRKAKRTKQNKTSKRSAPLSERSSPSFGTASPPRAHPFSRT